MGHWQRNAGQRRAWDGMGGGSINLCTCGAGAIPPETAVTGFRPLLQSALAALVFHVVSVFPSPHPAHIAKCSRASLAKPEPVDGDIDLRVDDRHITIP